MDASFDLIARAIASGPLLGAAAAIGDGADRRLECFGRIEAGGAEVNPDTWYDLASLTKVVCTVPLCLDAIAQGRLDPRAPLREVLPEVAWLQDRPNLGDATVLQLATHTSGLPAWQPLYTLGLDRPTLLARLLHTSLRRLPGPIEYSDLGFMLLGHVLERAYEQPLDVQAGALFARLGLERSIAFRAPADACVAPTEQCPWRGRMLCGEVHDENAAALGGVAGHAGLFGTLRGVAAYAQALLECRLQSAAVLSYLSQEHARAALPDLERRGFGWVLMHPGWSGGDLMSERSIGHTGFTGTGLWIDLERGRYSVLLTNRVHPSRHLASNIVGLRRAFNHAAHAP
ncbi:MAG TPA: serine hydrolase domain-containing protein [Chloroflexota bacterium]|nr:serine hydrolase domain-containing protein [Chloroflexota bacterium]